MSALSPRFSGEAAIVSPGPAFLEGMKSRVQSGLLTGRPHRRSRYAVIRHKQQDPAFRASDILSAVNVGLNEVTLRTAKNHSVEYAVTYVRWAAYVVGLGAVLGIVFVIAFLFWDIDAQVARYAIVDDPELNKAIALGLLWAFIAFWALIWPWILIVLHRPAARKLLERIIREVDIAAQESSQKT